MFTSLYCSTSEPHDTVYGEISPVSGLQNASHGPHRQQSAQVLCPTGISKSGPCGTSTAHSARCCRRVCTICGSGHVPLQAYQSSCSSSDGHLAPFSRGKWKMSRVRCCLHTAWLVQSVVAPLRGQQYMSANCTISFLRDARMLCHYGQRRRNTPPARCDTWTTRLTALGPFAKRAYFAVVGAGA